MKITLISPYSNLNSYGIKSISTFLRSRGITVSTIYLLNNFNHKYNPEIFNQVVELCSDSDLIGLSVMSNYFVNCVQITEEIKNQLSIPIVWGGVHPTLSPEECLKYCDIVVRGEGEETLLEIIKRIENHEPINEIPGLFIKQGDEILKNNSRLPMPVDDLVVIDNDFSSDYILLNNKIEKIDYKILKEYLTRDYMTLTSFGCPFNCSYCINNKLKEYYGATVRFKKVDDIINELILVKEKMDFTRHISFDDDAFILRSVEDLKEFAEKYQAKINLPFFISGINPMLISEDKIKILLSAGMDRVRMGIQTGSENGKIIYNRQIPNDKVIAAAQLINKYKHKLLLTGFDLILDNPFESRNDSIQTIRLLSKLPAPFTLNLFSLTFYPGTDMYKKANEAGFIKDDIEDIYKKQYHDIQVNYLNFIILLFTIHKVPNWVLNYLLSEKMMNKNLRISSQLFHFAIFMGYVRRGINFLLKGDPYTLIRHVKFSLAKK
ncbi:MAG: radical SAM protein [Candidatus Buchananbacteria bacterium]